MTTGLMFTVPILTFYIALYYIFPHKTQPDNWAAGCAILVTNLIVAGYCYSAYREDDTIDDNSNNENDRWGPRVGRFKERTD